jgi:opacity protein-like surface antigen
MQKIFAAFLLSTALVGTASARDTYVSVYGGANWNDVFSAPGVEDKTGTVLGGVLGTNVPAVPGLRIELDASYRTNDVDAFGLDVQHDTTALLGNVVYDLPVMVGGGQPYVLGGLGFAKTEAVVESLSLAKVEASDVAWQLGFGMNWKVADGVNAGVGYRYFQGPELQVLGTELSDGSNDSVVATVSFGL